MNSSGCIKRTCVQFLSAFICLSRIFAENSRLAPKGLGSNNYFAIASTVILAILFCVAYSVVFSLYHSWHIRRKGSVDDVTGILSLSGFEDQANKIFRAKRGAKFLITEINVRDFAFVNRLYGHDKGDAILKSIGQTLLVHMRGLPELILARGYADNFYALQRVTGDENEILDQMEYLLRNVQERVCNEEDVHIILKSGSIIARSSLEGKNVDLKDMISKAGYARHSTQDSAVENFSVYDAGMQIQHENEERIENSIEDAIHKNDLVVLYQPKINLQTGKIAGAEALIRWRSENGSMIPPNLFIPVLERNGMVGVLDQYVYSNVFKFLYRLKKENLPLVKISMNISRLNHNALDFVSDLDALQVQYQIDKKYIELEIEERFAGAGDDYIRDLIHRLHASGYQVSMDDFGSGQSSLNMLSEMPVDIVKFDQRFMQQAEYSKDSRIVLDYMIRMVNELGKVSLCEGVETEAHVKFLKQCGCNLAQGFYFSKPIDEEAFKKFLVKYSESPFDFSEDVPELSEA